MRNFISLFTCLLPLSDGALAVSVSSSNWSVTTSEKVACPDADCPWPMAEQLLVTDLASSIVQGFVLKTRTVEIRDLYIRGSTLLVLGSLKYGGDILNLVDLEELSLIDQIYGYDMFVSPTRRHILYNQWFQRMAPPEYHKGIVRVYDVERGPEANRVRSAVGHPLYPSAALDDPEIALEDGGDLSSLDPIWIGEESVIFWNSDEQRNLSLYSANLTEYPAKVCKVPLAPLEQSVTTTTEFARQFIPAKLTLEAGGFVAIEFRPQADGAKLGLSVHHDCLLKP